MGKHIKAQEEISKELCDFMARDLLADKVAFTSDTALAELGIDSYAIIEIILFIERNYGLAIPDNQLTPENLSTINSISLCTHNLLKGSQE